MSSSNRSSDICHGNFIFIFQYLHNLDVNSAFYDPKTRSMRENPFKGKDPAEYVIIYLI